MKMAIAFVMLVVLGLIFFIKHTKWIGVALILSLVGTMAFSVFCYYEVSESEREIRSSSCASLQIDDISYEAGTNDKGEEGYYFTLTIANRAGYVQTEKVLCYTDADTCVAIEPVSIYSTIGKDSVWYSEIMEDREIPPGTQATLMFFITNDILETVEGDKLIFQDAYSEIPITVSMEELR